MKKILSLLLCLSLVFAMAPAAVFAETETTDTSSEKVFRISSDFEDLNGDYTVEELLNKMLNEFTNPDVFHSPYTITLLKDTQIEIKKENQIGMIISPGQRGKENVLDLNGNTLTFTGSGIGISSISNTVIKNGIIHIASNDISAIANAKNYLLVDGVTITADENLSNIFGIVPSDGQSSSNTDISNCTVMIGENNTAFTNYFNSETTIISGQFTKNPVEENNGVKFADGTKALETLEGATGTVYTSSETTAIIVQNGRAYLYDTLQEAVDAAKKRGTGGEATITLVKQPDEKSVTLPKDANIILETIGEGIDTSKIPMTGPNGEKVEVSTDGKLEIKPSEPEPEPPTPPIVITYYDITATQPEHGTITLEHDRIYRYGDVDVTLTAEEGYEVKDLLINGVSVGAVSSYTIKGVTEDIHVTAVFGETEAAKKARIIKGVQDTDIKLTYKMDEIGKGWIKIRWTKEKGYAVDYYEVFRSAKSKANFGKEAYFTKNSGKINNWYKNTKQIKKGTRYYYKVRGVREIDGKTYYTKWSNTTWRTGR